MCTLMYENASVLKTTMGVGNHGHIGIAVRDTLYATMSPTTYAAPVDPGVTTTVPVQATISQ